MKRGGEAKCGVGPLLGAAMALACASGGSGRGDHDGGITLGDGTADDDDGDADAGPDAQTGDETGADDANDGGPSNEPCDGFDNDGDGDVDEMCACSPGAVQDCFAGPPRDAITCRATTQTCEAGGGSESFGTWGACGGLCDGSTLSLDDPTGTLVIGVAAGDRFSLVARAPLGDIDGDGELDMIAASAAGDGLTPDVGVAYVLYGGPCLQGATIDLAQQALDGSANDEFQGGFVVDNATAEGGGFALAADVDGDGRQDVVVSDTGNTSAVIFGSSTPQALYAASTPDGMNVTRLLDGGGSWGMRGGVTAGDYDGDGFADVFMSASNNSNPGCPCTPNGMAVWWGRAAFAAETPRDALVDIGIGTVGVASQSNYSVVGGFGDFDNDGGLDIVTGNGAANDGGLIAYRTIAWFGRSDRGLPSSMLSVDGTTGFRLVGGPGRGPHPNHQHGDFDGDGIDDLVAFAYVPYAVGAAVYVVYGRTGGFPAEIDAAAMGDLGTTIAAIDTLGPGYTMGVGDIDGDGFDDIAVPLGDADAGGLAIVWGRAMAGPTLDAITDPTTVVIAGSPGLGATEEIAIADVDGDGLGDVIVGAKYADAQNGEDSGAGFIKFGSCLASQHNPMLVRGQDGPDAIVGTNARESIASGRGDDAIDGMGGADAIAAGHGDDRIVVRDLDFARIHGGLGEDTLVIDAALTLDLRTIGRARIQEIERFELGPGAQTLAASPGDLSAMSSSTRTFVVEGDAADHLILDGDWIAEGDSDGDGLHAWRHGALVVLVRSGVVVN